MRLLILALGLLLCTACLTGCSGGGGDTPANTFSTDKTEPSSDELIKQKEAGSAQRSQGATKTRS